MAEDTGDELRDDIVPYQHEDLAPPDYVDPVIEAYKKDVDRTLLREMLKLTPQQRSEKFASFMELAYELRTAGERMRAKKRHEN